jgi:hypothetical protein
MPFQERSHLKNGKKTPFSQTKPYSNKITPLTRIKNKKSPNTPHLLLFNALKSLYKKEKTKEPTIPLKYPPLLLQVVLKSNIFYVIYLACS